jgi:hypothetical protein
MSSILPNLPLTLTSVSPGRISIPGLCKFHSAACVFNCTFLTTRRFFFSSTSASHVKPHLSEGAARFSSTPKLPIATLPPGGGADFDCDAASTAGGEAGIGVALGLGNAGALSGYMGDGGAAVDCGTMMALPGAGLACTGGAS